MEEGTETENQAILIYHCNLLHDNNLITADNMSNLSTGEYWMPNGLTWEGHDYLDAIRDGTTYNRAKKSLKEKGAELSFEALKAIAVSMAKAHLTGTV